MRRFAELKRLDKKTRNKLRAILSNGDANAIGSLTRLRGKLGKDQSDALEGVLNSSTLLNAVRPSIPFPKVSPFSDTLQANRELGLNELLSSIEVSVATHKERLTRLANSLQKIDTLYAKGATADCRDCIVESLETDGWSHALLRRIILIRENLAKDCTDDRIEELVQQAGIKGVVVASLIHAYSRDQNILTIKRSILNLADRGAINRYTRTLSKLPVQPFAASTQDLVNYLSEVQKCSLIDAIILAKFNAHLFRIGDYPEMAGISRILGQAALFDPLVSTFDAADTDSEYAFFKQSSAWLEYEPIRRYRILIDNYFDASRDEAEVLPASLRQALQESVGGIALHDILGCGRRCERA